jgi:predicted nucleic-acid-binding protein
VRLLDTNVILRWLLGDDAAQVAAVDRLFRRAERDGERFYLSDLVLAEINWVLLGMGKEPGVVARILATLVEDPRFEFDDRARLLTAVTLYEARGVDFIDAYQAALSQHKGLAGVVSFDRHFERLPVVWTKPS